MKKISVLIKDPGKNPRHVNISDSLGNLQKTVDGFIQTVTIATDLVIICNEEGLIRDLPYNCTIYGAKLFGTIIMCGVDGDKFADLPCDWETVKRLFPNLFDNKNREGNERGYLK